MSTAAQPDLPDTLAKGEFARLVNASASRVSHWIAEGKIGPDALEGEGRSAKIRVRAALAQLKRTIDPGQRYGNGATTRLEFAAAAAPPTPSQAPSADPVGDAIRQEKLIELRARNRKSTEEELARRGVYVRADEAAGAAAKAAGTVLQVCEAGLPDLAQALAQRFALPVRDVRHVMRTEFAAVRARAAEALKRAALDLGAHVEDHVPDVTDEPAGQA